MCIAASNGGTTSQDLKTGFLVGSTPRKQQIAILVGALASALPGTDVGRALAQRESASVRAQLAEAKRQARAAHLASTPTFLIARAGRPAQRFSPPGLDTSSFAHALDRALAGS